MSLSKLVFSKELILVALSPLMEDLSSFREELVLLFHPEDELAEDNFRG